MRRTPLVCPWCHGANNHASGFDCRPKSDRQRRSELAEALADRIGEMERVLVELAERAGIATTLPKRRR